MKKILGLTVAALLVMGLIGGGTWAYFSDPETATGNVFQAGTIDLWVDGNMSWTGTLGWTDAIAGITDTVVFKNAGTIPGVLTFANGTALTGLTDTGADDDTMDSSATFEYSAQVDSTSYEMSASQYAALIEVTDNLTFCTDLVALGVSVDINLDGKLSLDELYTYVGGNDATCNLAVGEEIEFTFTLFHAFETTTPGTPYLTDNMTAYSDNFTIHSSSVAWNVPQADGCKLDITVTLVQQ